MQKPFSNLLISTIIWLIIIVGFSFFKPSQKQFLIPQITIDAEMIGEEIGKKTQPKLKQKTTQEKHNDKTSDLKAKETKKTFHDHHLSEKQDSKIFKAKIISQPLPQIPDDLRKEAFATKAIARFYILANGNVEKIELIKMANNPKLNFLLMKSLKKWRFEANSQNSTQDIEVAFEVK